MPLEQSTTTPYVKGGRVECPFDYCYKTYVDPPGVYKHLKSHPEPEAENWIKELKARHARNSVYKVNTPVVTSSSQPASSDDHHPRVQQWISSIHHSHMLFNQGLELLKSITNLDAPSVPLIASSWREMFSRKPVLQHVLRDLFQFEPEPKNFIDMCTNSLARDVDMPEFLAEYINSIPPEPPVPTDDSRPLIAYGIPATRCGLLNCGPRIIANLHDIPDEYKRTEPKNESSTSPP